ncbi:MAG: phosphoribosylamine--glycine ligase [Ottowia sp.]|nr:phosphoribosylamine--glycine ligase [Ottowia sp.]
MKILIIGNGGREHALAWKLAQSPRIQRILVSPGNGGTAINQNFRNIAAQTPEEFLKIAQDEAVDITLVGPEVPLAAGVVDLFRSHNQKIFGPTRAAAQLESSKDFAKAFMARHGIPTARYQSFTDANAAHAYIDTHGAPIVVKADGLAAGKGVVVAMTTEAAHAAVDHMLADNTLGAAGARVVIEEFLSGEEASFIVMVDGTHILPLATSQDHKRLGDADTGPNTGGMGAYSPARIITPQLHARIMREIIQPTVQGMAKEGLPFTGFLYAGVMIDNQGNPKTLEFNCRMGDPETQVIMARLRTDFVDVLAHAVNGSLDQIDLDWDHRTALGVVLAASHYPENPRLGDRITGIPPDSDDHVVFHAGTRFTDGGLYTHGGRVLCVVALDQTVKLAQTRAYETIQKIHFEGMYYRRDIGHLGIKQKP